MAAHPKLTDDEVRQIRKRVRAGESQTHLADEFDVNRKTIRRRLDALEREEAERSERIAANRRRRQAGRERRKLIERERSRNVGHAVGTPETTQAHSRKLNPFHEWLDRPKSLSGRRSAEARGLVRLRSPDGTICKWVERTDVDSLLAAAWTLA